LPEGGGAGGGVLGKRGGKGEGTQLETRLMRKMCWEKRRDGGVERERGFLYSTSAAWRSCTFVRVD